MPNVTKRLASVVGDGAFTWAAPSRGALPPLPGLPKRGPLMPRGAYRPRHLRSKQNDLSLKLSRWAPDRPSLAHSPAVPPPGPSLTRGLSTPSSSIGGMLGVATLGGMAGYAMGDQNLASFGAGAVVGLGAGAFARPMTRRMMSRVSNAMQVNATAIKSNNPEAAAWMRDQSQRVLSASRAMNTKDGRYLMHAGGSLLAGGAFGSMFMSSNRKNHRRGFNQSRGNTF